MKFRKKVLKDGTEILLGRNAENNDELVKEFKGKDNIILHTVASGSPFCVILGERPTKESVNLSGAWCAAFSQDWRDHKSDVKINVFTGKDVSKPLLLRKQGSWKVKNSKTIKIKKEDIRKVERGTKSSSAR